MNGVQSILLVSRDAEDASWQMLTGEAFDIAEAKLVQLRNLVELDPSLLELADLPLGWSAGRERVGAPWTCQMPCSAVSRRLPGIVHQTGGGQLSE